MARPFRATFILGLVAVGTALAAVGGWRYARASAPVNGPIILISLDGVRADRLAAYGGHGSPTPSIDQLAADGVVFERAYAHTPQTLPAHASLLSGRLPFDTGVRDDLGFTVRGGERMLAEILRDRGYETGAVVSSFALRDDTGIGQGFAFFDAPGLSSDPSAEDVGGDVRRSGSETVAAAEQWLEQAGESRVFLWMHLARPPLDDYARQLAAIDDAVGQFVRYLKTHALYDQSTIILLADHGVGLGDHGEREHGLLVYDEAVRVPFIVKQAAGKGAGIRMPALVQHVDVAPTILDLAKAPLPGNLRGRSITPLLDGGDSLGARTAYAESLYGHYRFGWAAITSVTDGRHRLVRAADDELYDLEEDPRQTRNIVGEEREAEIHLRHALEGWTHEVTERQPVAPAFDVQTRVQQLGSVGWFIGRSATGAAADPRLQVDLLERYRRAVAASNRGAWGEALALILAIVRTEPSMTGAWVDLAAFALRSGRPEQAVDAYEEVVNRVPDAAEPRIELAELLLRQRRLDDAQRHAAQVAALEGATPTARAAGHALLARIAVVRRYSDAAREHAGLAQREDPALPLRDFIEGRLQFERGAYEEAAASFQQAAEALSDDRAGRVLPDLEYYLAETLVRLDRPMEAEPHFIDELRHFPGSIRAWTGLATLYRNTGRAEQSTRTLRNLLKLQPTADAHAAAARTWTAFGEMKLASEVRLDAQRAARSH